MTHVAYAGLVLVLVSLFLLGAGAIADEGVSHSGERTDIVEEQFNPSVGLNTLDNSNSPDLTYSDDIQVKDKNGNHSIEGQDFEWNANNGTIDVLAGGNLDGDNSATINYTIWNPTETDDRVRVVIVNLLETGRWIPIALLVAIIVGAVTVLGGLS